MKSIIGTGQYRFHIGGKNIGIGKGEVFLEFRPSSQDMKKTWNNEQIRDFVRKVGLINQDESDGDDLIKPFLRLNQVQVIVSKYLSGCSMPT